MEFENHQNYNCKVETDTGQEYLLFSNWIHNNNLDSWQGWHCQAGSKRLYIDKNFDVWSGECKNDSLGNALDNFSILPHAVCKRVTCTGCTDDLMVAKKKP